MPIETGNFINDLTPTNPTSSDAVGQGDDHLRLIKACVQGSLPNLGGIINQARVMSTSQTISSVYNTSQIIAGATITLTLPPSASITAGWMADIQTIGSNVVTIQTQGAQSINGSATMTIPGHSVGRVYYQGADVWRGHTNPGGTGIAELESLRVNGTLSVSGATVLQSTLHVDGATTISGATVLNSTLSVSGAATLVGGLHVDGATTLSGAAVLNSTLSVSGAVMFNSTLTVSGATSLLSTLSVAGATTLGALTVSGATTLKSTLSISGAATFGGAVTVNGATNLSGAVTVSGAATLKGVASFAAAVTLGTTLSVSGAATLQSTLTVSGAATLQSTLNVLGATTLSGTVVMRQLLDLNSGQILFPSSQNASADVNTLDDYEEGTFTPTLTFATPGNLNVVYSVRIGQYTKIGDTVYVNLRVTTSTFTHTTASGNSTVSGLPFTALAVTSGRYALTLAYMAGAIFSANNILCGAYMTQNTSQVNFDASNFAAGTISTITAANHATGTTQDWQISGVYKTAT
jgi:cytoskeletal protein CcmA (bactofilin family)